MKKYKDYKSITKYDISQFDEFYNIKNAMIESFEIKFNCHYCFTTLSLSLNCCSLFNDYGVDMYLNELIKILFGILDIKDEYINISELKNVPCIIVCDGCIVVGIGNFLTGEMALIQDMIDLAIKNTLYSWKIERIGNE